MANNGGVGPLPFRVANFLQSSYYVVSIIIVLLGLVSFMLSLKWRIDEFEAHEREHPNRHDLVAVAVKVEDRIVTLEKLIEDINIHGTRALGDRTTLLEEENHTQGERQQELVRRVNELQSSMNKIQSDIGVITDRQNNNTSAVRDLQQRLWSSSGERGPTAPINLPQHPQH